jgi:hypothetical protein
MAVHDVKSKVILIVGGGKNLGQLLSRRAKLVVHYNSESSKAESEKTLAEVQALGVEAFLYQSDLTKVKNVSRLTGGWWITGQTIFANGGYTTR